MVIINNTRLKLEVAVVNVVVEVMAVVAVAATATTIVDHTRIEIATTRVANRVRTDHTRTLIDPTKTTIVEIKERKRVTTITRLRRSKLTGARELTVLSRSMTSLVREKINQDNHVCKSLTLHMITRKAVMKIKEATLSLIDRASIAVVDVVEDVVVEAVAVEDVVIVTTATTVILHSNNTKKSITGVSKVEPTTLAPTLLKNNTIKDLNRTLRPSKILIQLVPTDFKCLQNEKNSFA